MMTSPSTEATSRITTCPLCGQPNGCVPARTGGVGAPCWCADIRISKAVLDRIPEAQRGRACLCARCAAGEGQVP